MSFSCTRPPAGTGRGTRARRAPAESRRAISTVAGWPVTSVTPTLTRKPAGLKQGTRTRVAPAAAAEAAASAGVESPNEPPRGAVVDVRLMATTLGAVLRKRGP